MQVLATRHRLRLYVQTLGRLNKPFPLSWEPKFCLQCFQQYGSVAPLRQHDLEPLKVQNVGKPPLPSLGGFRGRRQLANVSNGAMISWQGYAEEFSLIIATVNHNAWGPLKEYDERIHAGQLRDDEHQRGIRLNASHNPRW